LVEKESDTLVGAAGLWHPGDFPETEVKWLLFREFWGRGYATENEGSLRVAAAVGAVHERNLAFRDAEWMVYRHPERTEAK
jgi:RimJ/RimL family protein N-acetyltransferase